MTKITTGLSIFIRVSLFIAFVGGAIFCIWAITGTQLTNRESALLGLIISALSVLAGWIITDLYASSQYESTIREVREEYRTNLRTYALKASEKVSNLSSELNKLATYLEEELAYTDYRSTEDELLAKEERIESAIHIVRTLKTVNDTAMSDWEGVIGDELDERREVLEEKQQELTRMIERMQQSLDEQKNESGVDDTTISRSESLDLRRQLERAMFSLNNTTVPKTIWKEHKKAAIEQPCPSCGIAVSYRQKPLTHSVKALSCEKCETKLMSRYDEIQGFRLEARRIENVEIKTPCCNVAMTVALDTFPGTSVQLDCAKCGSKTKVLRTRTGVDVKSSASLPEPKTTEALTEDIIEKVAAALPKQPWQSGTHKIVAEKLGLSPARVNQATQELIKRGKVHHQIDGVLYGPIKPA